MPKLGMINYAGASEGRVAPIMAEEIKENKGQSLIVVPTLNRAKAEDQVLFTLKVKLVTS